MDNIRACHQTERHTLQWPLPHDRFRTDAKECLQTQRPLLARSEGLQALSSVEQCMNSSLVSVASLTAVLTADRTNRHRPSRMQIRCNAHSVRCKKCRQTAKDCPPCPPKPQVAGSIPVPPALE